MGLGDDQAPYGYFTALDTWLTNILNTYAALQGSTEMLAPILTMPLDDINYDIRRLYDKGESCVVDNVLQVNPPKDCKHQGQLIWTSVISNHRLTSEDWQYDVRHLVLKIPPEYSMINISCQEPQDSPRSSGLYETGDVAYIYPTNNPTLVQRAINLLAPEYSPHTILEITPTIHNVRAGKGRLGATTCSVYELFSKYLDIQGVPPRSFFAFISHFATNNDEEKDKLLELSSPAGTDLYYEYCVREKRCYIDILEDFRSVRLQPLSRVIEVFPSLKPRQYSIASSAMAYPNEVCNKYTLFIC